MNATQAAVLEMFAAVQGFLVEKKPHITPIDESGAAKNLGDVATQVGAQSVDQRAGQTGSMGETARQTKLRRVLLHRHIYPVAAIAKTLSPQVPEVSAFAAPASDTSSIRLVASAHAMADSAKPHEAALVAAGLPADFIDQLHAAAESLKESLTVRAQHSGRAKGATRAIQPLMRRGLATVRVLDALITAKLEGNERLLGEWEKAKSVRKKKGPAQGGTHPPGASEGTPVTPIVQGTPAVPSTNTLHAAAVADVVSAA